MEGAGRSGGSGAGPRLRERFTAGGLRGRHLHLYRGGLGTAPAVELVRLQGAFGMTKEDADVLLASLVKTGKLAVGSMGDDTPPAALLDDKPRRLEDHFKLRFAQETSPPIDPIRDAWVFESSVALGDRSGLWGEARGTHYVFPHRVLAQGELCWLRAQPDGRGNAVLALHPAQGQGMDLAMDAMLLHSFTRLVQGAVAKTDWDIRLELPRAPMPAMDVAAGSKPN